MILSFHYRARNETTLLESLTLPNNRTRRRVARRDRVINAQQEAGIRRLIGAGQRNRRARAATATASDLNLRATEIELRAAGRARTMQPNMLNAEQVLARGCSGGERERPAGGLIIPHHAGGGEAGGALLPDFEPHVAVTLERLDVAVGGFGEVGCEGARVRDDLVGLETNLAN